MVSPSESSIVLVRNCLPICFFQLKLEHHNTKICHKKPQIGVPMPIGFRNKLITKFTAQPHVKDKLIQADL